jgi:hypothetical protein
MNRDELIAAIQAYAEEWATGKSIMHSPAKIALSIALDHYEAGVIAETQCRCLGALREPCCFCKFAGPPAEAPLTCFASPSGQHCACWRGTTT